MEMESDLGTEAGRRAWRAIVEDPAGTLLCSDFDGVLSPIVRDPDAAWASEETVGALARLGQRVGKVAVVTGRMARKAVQLGRLDERQGLETMSVLGLYGFERWDAATGEFDEPRAPDGVAAAAAEIPRLLAGLGLGSARVEDKRLSIGVHTRELDDPQAAYAALEAPLIELAARHDLRLEPGKFVFELRAPGINKGDAVRRLVAEVRPRTIVFAGDDLGDVPAFEAVRELREAGTLEGLLICSGSDEQDALQPLADIVVPGPPGVAELLDRLATELER
ncbi:trehalose-phosphatase [Granulicoccus sp. GXG6511]|uniref:trehalose-phosphatase n=1 Tax=Granulicoccus sp. GXG6511 TaxID=3381351 RepID=UPI003D7C4F91